MVQEKVRVRNKSGLHLRPATELSQVASRLTSDILILFGEKRINPKSVLMLMGAGIKPGSEIVIQCTGENEEADLKVLVDTINAGFGEEMID